MEMQEILSLIFQMIIIPLLGILTKYAVDLISTKIAELVARTDNDNFDKYLILLNDTISNCVVATNQTYVEALKAQNAFDAEAQKVAFKQTYDAVMSILTEDAKKYLQAALGDLDVYVTNSIESQVNASK